MARMKMTPETEFRLFELENKLHKAALSMRVLTTGLCSELERLTRDDGSYMPRGVRWKAIKDMFQSLDQVVSDGIVVEAEYFKLQDRSFRPRRKPAPRSKAVPLRTLRKAVIVKKD